MNAYEKGALSANDNYNHKELAFFGRRKGKPLREHAQFLTENLLPQLLIDIKKPAPLSLNALFGKNYQQKPHNIILEIGFGGGERLLHALKKQPDSLFIGVEPFINAMAKLLKQLELEPALCERIRLFNNDAILLLDWLPKDSLSQIDLFYPDPWPKKRHHKRRFVQKKNLDRFAKVLKSNGLFRFASDISDYVSWCKEHCAAHDKFALISDSNNTDNYYHDWLTTRYEKKALREGRQPRYLAFCCNKGATEAI